MRFSINLLTACHSALGVYSLQKCRFRQRNLPAIISGWSTDDRWHVCGAVVVAAAAAAAAMIDAVESAIGEKSFAG